MVDQNDSINAQVHARGDASHRPEQAGLAQAVTEDPRRVRAATIRVHHGAGGGSAAPAGHLQGINDPLGAHLVFRIDHPTIWRVNTSRTAAQ